MYCTNIFMLIYMSSENLFQGHVQCALLFGKALFYTGRHVIIRFAGNCVENLAILCLYLYIMYWYFKILRFSNFFFIS
jgi:hypothetical protein